MDAVLNWLSQGGVVGVAAWVLLLALTRARANVRYAVCWAAAVSIVVLPVLPQLPSTTGSPHAFDIVPVDGLVSLPDAWWTSTLLILAAWTLWVGVQTFRFASAILAIRRARAGAQAISSGVESGLPHWCRIRSRGRRARLVVSDSVTTAAVLGWGTPMIAVAPSLMTMLDADELDRVLVHEWAHVQRRDDLGNILQVVLHIALGWHPALWWLNRRLHIEREIACDELTVAVTGSPKSYAACLVKLSGVGAAHSRLRMAPAVFTRSSLRVRVRRIVSRHPALAPIWARSLALAAVSMLGLVSVELGRLNLVEAAELTLPFVSSRALNPPPAPAAPLNMAAPTLGELTNQAAARDARPQASQLSPSPTSRPQSTEPPADGAEEGLETPSESPGIVEPVVARPIGELVTTMLPQTPPAPPVARPGSRSPWSAAASGGAAVGRKSKEAGVATAGFFTRVARRVAGSF